jgi:thioredoxin-related protein
MYKVIAIIVLIVLIYSFNDNSQFASLQGSRLENSSNQNKPKLKVYWFHRPTCPYCVEMKDEWAGVEAKMRGSTVSTESINISEPRHAAKKQQFQIDSVPTIIKVSPGGVRTEYNGDRNTGDIVKWISQ